MINPKAVISPKSRLKGPIEERCNTEEGGFSVATFLWDGRKSVGIRWNGEEDEEGVVSVGNPQSRGLPTWFIVPEDLEQVVLDRADEISGSPRKPAAKAAGNEGDELEARIERVVQRMLKQHRDPEGEDE